MHLNWRQIYVVLVGSWGFLLVSVLPIGAGAVNAQASTSIHQETQLRTLHSRLSFVNYRFIKNGVTLSGFGPEFALERSLSPKLAISGAIGQAYTVQNEFSSLLTSLEVAAWYSVWGNLATTDRVWKDGGASVLSYRQAQESSLRLGVAAQQVFFNSSAGAVPFSGLCAKMLYVVGLDWLFDVGVGMDYGQLVNTTTKASTMRMFVTAIFEFD